MNFSFFFFYFIKEFVYDHYDHVDYHQYPHHLITSVKCGENLVSLFFINEKQIHFHWIFQKKSNDFICDKKKNISIWKFPIYVTFTVHTLLSDFVFYTEMTCHVIQSVYTVLNFPLKAVNHKEKKKTNNSIITIQTSFITFITFDFKKFLLS